MKKLLFYFCLIFCIACAVKQEAPLEAVKKDLPKQTEQKDPCAVFNKEILALAKQDQYFFFPVDKKRHLPAEYTPADLIGKGKFAVREQTKKAFDKMAEAAKKEGINLFILSGFRPYARQEYLFNRSVKTKGKAHADKYVARPGASQHQLGSAVDINSVEDSFVNTKEYAWLKKNAAKFGFSLSFPKGQEDKTGYSFEPWHYRYITIEGCQIQQEHFNDSQVDFLDALNACFAQN